MKNIETTEIIQIVDRYGNECLSDSVGDNKEKYRTKPKGYVEIYDGTPSKDNKLFGKNNLVVYEGREWIAEKIFSIENGSTTTTPEEFICWFGVGSGGADVVNAPLTPYNPSSSDTGLGIEAGLGIGNDAPGHYADFRGGDYYKHPFDSVTFEQDVANDNKWLMIKVITTLDTEDSNGNNLNEAGLFTAESLAAGYAGPFHLYSRVTFPTLVKTEDRQLVFIWYIYV